MSNKGFSIDIRPVLSSNGGLHYAPFDIILQAAAYHLSVGSDVRSLPLPLSPYSAPLYPVV